MLTVSVALALSPAAHGQRFVISGHGWGHGVGMSQYGADGLAIHGWSYTRILGHYYPGTKLQRAKPVNVRVLLLEKAKRVVISARSPFRVVGRKLTLKRLVVRRGRRLSLRVEAGATPLRLNGKAYRGDLVVRRGLVVVNELPLERYLRGVVPWEMPYYWHPAALAAQTIAARTYALHQLHANPSFDLYADARDQMYGGIAAERGSTNRIVGTTHGLVLTWHGLPALTYYDSTSGGRTASSADAFQLALPYLPSVSDPYDSLSPHHSWRYRYTARLLARKLDVPSVKKVAQAVNHSGRVAFVAVHWRGGVRIMSGKAVQARLSLPSTWFRISAAKS